mmetsp:Transcript_140508/g.199170  ORF Transcript_140508/g.199170 Transcript_140508/m.199170 type:complete len:94 (-) Transcript_140508:82-363(-)|eukprot:symbB.v1.2.016964.t1/scaffold1308.1/size125923/10
MPSMRTFAAAWLCLIVAVARTEEVEAEASCDEPELLKVQLVQTKMLLQRSEVPTARGVELLDLSTTSSDFIAAVERLEARVRSLDQRVAEADV